MNAKKTELRAYLTPQEFKEQVVNWSKDTLKRRIENDGFPAIKDSGGGLLIPVDKMHIWFKKRGINL